MKRKIAWVALCCALSAVMFTACRNSTLPPYQPNPNEGTHLYFANCDPFAAGGHRREGVTLVPDPADACSSPIHFFVGYAAFWRSNEFLPEVTELTEGVHLIFSRSSLEAADTTVLAMSYVGVAVIINQVVVLPPGELNSSLDYFVTGSVSNPSDSTKDVSLSIAMLQGSATMNVSVGSGSHVVVGLERATLCEFEIDLGLTGGIGEPNTGVNFSYLYPQGDVQTSLLFDFTRGAQVENTVLVFGPEYGMAFLTAQSGACRDTVMFLAPAPAQGYRVDTLAAIQRGNLLSDGNYVWYWGVESASGDSAGCRTAIIRNTVDVTVLSHPIYNCTDQVNVYFDQLLNFFWIIERNPLASDTAWGYTSAATLDTVVVANSIPDGFLYRGWWLTISDENDYTRSAMITPFIGGSPIPLGDFPVDLTEDFAGGAGIGYPGALGYNNWSINVFDNDGNWVARYPIQTGDMGGLLSASILSADSIVIYSAMGSTNTQVFALKSH